MSATSDKLKELLAKKQAQNPTPSKKGNKSMSGTSKATPPPKGPNTPGVSGTKLVKRAGRGR